MWFDDPRILDACVYDLVLSQYPRGLNRARIQKLANGAAPYTQAEVEENNIAVNVSDLSHTRLMHDARSQYANNFLKNEFFARARLDAGPAHLRSERSAAVTRHWNRPMKRSVRFYEKKRAEFGNLVLHGIAPAVWENQDAWCSKPLGVEDVLLPGETLLGFDNLPMIVIRRSFTGIELMKLTDKMKRNPGWNMPFVEKILTYLQEQTSQLRSQNWPDVWQPEKIAERMKESAGGLLAGDRAPRMDVFDIYAYDEHDGRQGWVRRMILDSWSEPTVQGESYSMNRLEGVRGDTNKFLFNSGRRFVAQSWQNIASFQYADLSAVFPARYDSVRGLGWMMYGACHLSNRLRCKFYESVFEALNMLFEVDSADDAQNALKLDLVNRGFIDKTIRPVKAQDRWQVNANLVELGLRDNQQVISTNSSSMTPITDFSRDRTEKTRFQVMAELQAATSLASAAITQAAQYQIFEQRENFRRFCRPNSKDTDVRKFQADCIADGVPMKYLHNPDAWDISSEQVPGAGNQTLAMTIAQQMMAWRDKFDAESQRKILRDATLAITSDAAYSRDLVPELPSKVTRGTREAEHISADILQGIMVEPMEGENHIEVIETMLRILTQRVQAGLQQGGMVPPKDLQGLMGIAQHIEQRIAMLAQDKDAKERVRAYAKTLGQLQNQLKAFGQRLQQAMKKQQQAAAQQGNGQGGMDPKDAAKIQATMATAQAKIKLGQQSHAAKTAQRQIAFEAKLRQDQQKHQAELAEKDLETASGMARNRLTSTSEEE